MSVEAISHIMRTHIPDGVAKLVAMVLADYADPRTGQCWPKVPTLAAQCSQSVRTVQRKLKVLEELDVLHVEPNRTGDRKGNMYVLHLPGVPQAGLGRRRRDREAAGTGDTGGAMPEPRATGDTPSPVPAPERVPDGHPTGDSADTRRVTLLSPPMENPPENPSERIPPNPPMGGHARASPKLLRGNGVTARPVPVPAAPPPAGLDPDSAARFERLWASYPTGGRIDSDRGAAERYFAEMTPDEQDLAVRLVPEYLAHLHRNPVRGQPARAKALHTWLRTRRFRNLVRPGASTGAPAAAGRVFVREGTSAWEAWQGHQRAAGRIPMPATWSDTARASGWWFPAEMPPAAAA